MTNKNYTLMSNIELLDEINSIDKKPVALQAFIQKTSPELWKEIKHRTLFLEDGTFDHISILMRIYCLKHNIQQIPLCKNPNCPNKSKVGWDKRNHKFRDFCSSKCSANSEETKNKTKYTCQKKWGVDNPFQSKEIISKIKKSMLERHGVEHALQSKEIMKKAKQSWNKNLGVDCPLKSKTIRTKSINTLKKNFGVENPMFSDKIKEKVKQSIRDNLGVDWAMQSTLVQEKSKNTNLKNRGVPYPMMSKEVRDKSIAKCRENWDVDNYVQTREYHQHAHKRYTNPKYPDMTFDSSWEFLVYDFLVEHNIPFEYQVEPIEYEYNGKIHKYFPDFRVNGKIYEVKGDNFFRINESTNKEEMFCPWRNSNWSDEYYKWRCGLEEAKHQCMIANNVTILRHSQIKNLTFEIFT